MQIGSVAIPDECHLLPTFLRFLSAVEVLRVRSSHACTDHSLEGEEEEEERRSDDGYDSQTVFRRILTLHHLSYLLWRVSALSVIATNQDALGSENLPLEAIAICGWGTNATAGTKATSLEKLVRTSNDQSKI